MEKTNNPPKSQTEEDTSVIHRSFEAYGYDAPLPPPHLLEHYEKISPGFAERIVSMAEAEMNHRHAIERKNLDAGIYADNKVLADYAHEIKLGQIFAFVITLFLASLGAFVIISGYPVSGTVLSSTGIGGIVTTFILGRSRGSESK